jgi:hypothetical protein
MEYQHDIHGCVVLRCGEDGPSGQRSMNRHVKPAERQKHKNTCGTLILVLGPMQEHVDPNLSDFVVPVQQAVVPGKGERH